MLFRMPLIVKKAVTMLLIATAGFSLAEDTKADIGFFGSAEIQAGQYKNFKYLPNAYELTDKWMQDNIMTMGIRSKINDRLSGDVSLKAWLYYNPFPDSLMTDRTKDMNAPTIDFYMRSARMKLRLSPDPEDSLFNLELGIFPFKYNQDVRNLGEYLFRTGCYPGYIYSEGFDLAGTQLAGIHLRNNLFDGMIKNDIFFTSELYLYPSKDFSLTFLTDITPMPNRVINFGAGVQLFRFLPVDEAYTTPTKYEHMYGSPEEKTAPNWYVIDGDSSNYYTFAGTKIMARLAFDPKPLFGSPAIFGPEDLKCYSEAIILGVKNYPANPDSNNFYGRPINEFGYNKLIEKMPIMIGFNWPTHPLLSYTIAPAILTFGLREKGKKIGTSIFNNPTLIAAGTGVVSGFGLWSLEKIFGIKTGLDLLSIELEYYGKKYVNRVPIYANSSNMLRLPLPYDPKINQGYPYGDSLTLRQEASGEYSKETYKRGVAQWKWSVYAKRTLFERFDITLQFARDHTLIKTGLAQNVDFEEIFIKDKQWYWMLKFGYSF